MTYTKIIIKIINLHRENIKEKRMTEFQSKIRTIEWMGTYSKMVDQTKFPTHFEYVDVTTDV